MLILARIRADTSLGIGKTVSTTSSSTSWFKPKHLFRTTIFESSNTPFPVSVFTNVCFEIRLSSGHKCLRYLTSFCCFSFFFVQFFCFSFSFECCNILNHIRTPKRNVIIVVLYPDECILAFFYSTTHFTTLFILSF